MLWRYSIFLVQYHRSVFLQPVLSENIQCSQSIYTISPELVSINHSRSFSINLNILIFGQLLWQRKWDTKMSRGGDGRFTNTTWTRTILRQPFASFYESDARFMETEHHIFSLWYRKRWAHSFRTARVPIPIYSSGVDNSWLQGQWRWCCPHPPPGLAALPSMPTPCFDLIWFRDEGDRNQVTFITKIHLNKVY